MADLLQVFGEGAPEFPEVLEPVRLGANPTMLLMFSREGDPAQMHYLDDPAVHSFVPCCGPGCPLCYVGSAPVTYHLLPVVNVMRRAVQVLRVPSHRGPGSLAAGLVPHLGEGVEDKLFLVRREGSKYAVQTQALGEDGDRCLGVIAGFLQAQEQGLRLSSAFPEFTAAELAEVPMVRRALNAMGGWTATDGTSD